MNKIREIFKTNQPLRTTAGVLIGSLALTACGANQSETSMYQKNLAPDAKSLTICDGAVIRDSPHVHKDAENNVIDKVTYGNAPSGTCIDVPSEAIYATDRIDDNNGVWYGLPESELSKFLVDTRLSSTNDENLVWINEARAKINKPSDPHSAINSPSLSKKP